jgi:hypothetical protein
MATEHRPLSKPLEALRDAAQAAERRKSKAKGSYGVASDCRHNVGNSNFCIVKSESEAARTHDPARRTPIPVPVLSSVL